MNLVIDIGNTQYKICVFHYQEMVFHSYYQKLDAQLIQNLIAEHHITKGIYSDTRGINQVQFYQLFPKNFPITELSHETSLPLKLDYETPLTLGKDRIAGAVGARTQFPEQPVLVIDIGTAITIDFVSADGIFQGGIISPGPELRYKALHQFTGKLPLLEPVENASIIGKSTKSSIEAGVQNGILYEISGYISHYINTHANLKILTTGGYSYLFDNKINYPIFADSFLIPKGLNQILNHNG